MTINLNAGVTDEAKAVQQNLADQIENMAAIMAQRMAKGESLKDIQKIGIIVDANEAEDES